MYCLPGLPHVVDVGVVGGVGRLGRRRGLPLGDGELLLHELGDALVKVLVPPQAHIGVQELGLLQGGHVGGQQLGVVGHHRAVVVVVADALVVVVGHAGVPDGVHPLLHQGLHMAVEQLGGVAHRVRGDGVLALQVELPGGLGGEDHLEVELGEEGRTRRAGSRTCSGRRGCPCGPGRRCRSPCPAGPGASCTCSSSGRASPPSPCPGGGSSGCPR